MNVKGDGAVVVLGTCVLMLGWCNQGLRVIGIGSVFLLPIEVRMIAKCTRARSVKVK